MPETASSPMKEMPEPLTWQQFNSLRDHDRHCIAMFVHILENSRKGTPAPAEEYISNLVLQHWYAPLTPKIAADATEQFEQNFEMATNISREFMELYPETMREHVETVYGQLPAGGGI